MQMILVFNRAAALVTHSNAVRAALSFASLGGTLGVCVLDEQIAKVIVRIKDLGREFGGRFKALEEEFLNVNIEMLRDLGREFGLV